jgi:hypothetical protein
MTMTTRTTIYCETVHITADDPAWTGWYWFQIPARLLNAPVKKKLKFFRDKAERHGPFQTAEVCNADQEKTLSEEIGCEITDGGEWPASWSIN